MGFSDPVDKSFLGFSFCMYFEEHDKWEYREGGWGLNGMEININPSSYWFIDVYPNSNTDLKLQKQNIYIYGK